MVRQCHSGNLYYRSILIFRCWFFTDYTVEFHQGTVLPPVGKSKHSRSCWHFYVSSYSSFGPKLYRTLVRPALLCGWECWTVKESQDQRMQLAEMRVGGRGIASFGRMGLRMSISTSRGTSEWWMLGTRWGNTGYGEFAHMTWQSEENLVESRIDRVVVDPNRLGCWRWGRIWPRAE